MFLWLHHFGAWLAGHYGYYLGSGHWESPFELLRGVRVFGKSVSFTEAAGSTGHLYFILAGELRTKASGRKNSPFQRI